MFKKIVLSLLCVASMVFGVANAENVVNPYELANNVASKVIDDIKANKDRLADKKVALSIINNDLMRYVDVKYAAYKVIGTSLKTTSPEDREKFTEAFAVYMQENFASVLSKYTNQQIIIYLLVLFRKSSQDFVTSSGSLILYMFPFSSNVKIFLKQSGISLYCFSNCLLNK